MSGERAEKRREEYTTKGNAVEHELVYMLRGGEGGRGGAHKAPEIGEESQGPAGDEEQGWVGDVGR